MPTGPYCIIAFTLIIYTLDSEDLSSLEQSTLYTVIYQSKSVHIGLCICLLDMGVVVEEESGK